MDEDNSAWLKTIKSPALAHSIYVIGQVSNRQYYLVGAASSRITSLQNLGLPLWPVFMRDSATSADPWAPSKGEVDIYGVIEAERRSSVTFAKTAAECVSWPRGLALCVREVVDEEHKHLLIPMEWMVLLEDIVVRFSPVH